MTGDHAQPQHDQINERAPEPTPRPPWIDGSPARLIAALLCGIIFGFLLQKGGVAKFDILIGVLLLEKFTVVKVMLSAIVVGMIGVAILRRIGALELQIKDAKLGSSIVGGLIFGVGFALLGYCPGTNAAALGQGNLDALVGVAGLLAGSYLFALLSRVRGATAVSWGDVGSKRLPDLASMPAALCTAITALVLVAVLVAIELLLR